MSDLSLLDDDQHLACLQALARDALKHWDGDFVSLDLIKYRENAVFCARCSDGTRSVLRVHREGYHSEAALRSELTWMEQLSSGGIGVPRIIRTRDNEHLVEMHSPQLATPRYVDMLGWIAGDTLGSAEHGLREQGDIEAMFFQAGAMAARIHVYSAQWRQPNEFTRHAWDEEGLLGASPFWGRFWELDLLDEQQRSLLQLMREEARHDLRRYGRNLDNFGMIHADLVPENLLLSGTELQLIDFDDAGFGWHMFELATALYFCQDYASLNKVERALLDGYDSVKPLSPIDRASLPLFLALRGSTYLGWVHTRRGSRTATELAPMLIERACTLARAYLEQR